MKNLNDMAKRFNTTGNCNPKYHYMVNIDDKLEQIEALINDGLYFTINRARQFGKTTTMWFIRSVLRQTLICFFQRRVLQRIVYEIGKIRFFATRAERVLDQRSSLQQL